MSVRIRLRRVGRKKQPYFRVVVAKGDAPRDGKYIEEVGFYNPRTRPAFLTMDLDKVDEWIGKGAEVSTSAASLIRKARKGGDDTMKFVKPGEEAPRLKTATKPERRPEASASVAETPEGPPAEKTDPLEGAAPDAEKEPPAEGPPVGGETAEAVADTEVMAPKSKKAATDADKTAEDAPPVTAEAETETAAEPEEKPEGKAEVKAAVAPAEESAEAPEAAAEAETESEAEVEEPAAQAAEAAKTSKKKASAKKDEAESDTEAETDEE